MFNPDPVTLLTLRQRGLSRGQIKDLADAFYAQESVHNDDAFLRFCTRNACPSEILLFPTNWKPSKNFSLDIPKPVLTEYLKNYVLRYRDKVCPSSDLDRHFEVFCLDAWSQDARNPNSKLCTYMHKDWSPQDQTIEELLSEGFERDYLDLLLMEFKLYWLEKAEQRFDWDSKFRKHARYRLERKNLHNLPY